MAVALLVSVGVLEVGRLTRGGSCSAGRVRIGAAAGTVGGPRPCGSGSDQRPIGSHVDPPKHESCRRFPPLLGQNAQIPCKHFIGQPVRLFDL